MSHWSSPGNRGEMFDRGMDKPSNWTSGRRQPRHATQSRAVLVQTGRNELKRANASKYMFMRLYVRWARKRLQKLGLDEQTILEVIAGD